MLLVGIDVGGTFTDCVVFDEETCEFTVNKVPSTPPMEERGVIESIQTLGLDLGTVRRLILGTTVGTNAIVVRQGARTAILTTGGFKDSIEIGRTLRYTGGLFDPQWVRPQPLVPRSLRFEVPERMDAKGRVVRELRAEDVRAIGHELRRLKVESVAVCFLHSYINAEHERKAGRLLEEYLPGVVISLSADVDPEYREYERFSTTVANAYVAPRVRRHIQSVEHELRSKGYKPALFVMYSSGGVGTANIAAAHPIMTTRCGPAGGVSASLCVAEAAGQSNIITCDMGGTSTDVCLVKNLQPSMSTEMVIEGLPVRARMLDVNCVGAGGGSIAWVDIDKSLKVGPQSAGAVPGPACYGAGGNEVTVTDANLFLSRIGPSSLLRGRIGLSPELSKSALARLADKVGISDLYRLAEGVITIVVTNMANAIREISVERGYDPRDFTLVAYGGAGPMHAIPVAMELGISKVLVPRYPGNLSALGGLYSDLKHDLARTYLTPLERVDLSRVNALRKEMTEEGRGVLLREGIPLDRIGVFYSEDMRYLGQASQLNVSSSGDGFDPAEAERLFHREHHRAYRYSRQEKEVELVNLRVSVSGYVDKLGIPRSSAQSQALSEAIMGRRKVYFQGELVDCPIYDRDLLPLDVTFKGSAIIEELGATTVVFPGWMVTGDELGNLMLEQMR